jgi:hypothetical protein
MEEIEEIMGKASKFDLLSLLDALSHETPCYDVVHLSRYSILSQILGFKNVTKEILEKAPKIAMDELGKRFGLYGDKLNEALKTHKAFSYIMEYYNSYCFVCKYGPKPEEFFEMITIGTKTRDGSEVVPGFYLRDSKTWGCPETMHFFTLPQRKEECPYARKNL